MYDVQVGVILKQLLYEVYFLQPRFALLITTVAMFCRSVSEILYLFML